MVDTLRISVGKQLGVSRHRIKLLREGQAQYESFEMTAWVDYWWLVWFCFEREVVGVEMNEFWWTTESSQFLDQVLNNSSTVRHGHAKKMMNSWRCGPFSQSTDLLVRQSDNHVFVVFCQEETCTSQDGLHFLVGKMLLLARLSGRCLEIMEPSCRESGLEDGNVLTAIILPPVYAALGGAWNLRAPVSRLTMCTMAIFLLF